ncbi:ATP-binding protein [Haloparvum sp. PAK95]|uniref:sensor histidine kinase n=1 Tax=Haloparvum sp. PAK95 TaxID=3418962 RepID=UPI003D2EAFE6
MTRRQTKSTSRQPPAMMVVDDDAVVASATEPVEQVFGYAPAELVDSPVETVVADGTTVPVAGESPPTGATRARCLHASGAEFTARLAWAPLASAPRVAVTVEDAFVARRERYDAALRAAARSLVRATTWDEAAGALVRTAGSVSGVDDVAVYETDETAETLRPVAALGSDPHGLKPPATASARRALESDSLTRRDGDEETALSVPLDDRALLRLVVQRGPAVDQAASFARKLASYGSAARSRLAGPETGAGARDAPVGNPTKPVAPESETSRRDRPPRGDTDSRDDGSIHDECIRNDEAADEYTRDSDAADDEADQNARPLAQRNAELRERVERLEQRNAELQEFTDVVAHDLRNPLNVAQACVELAESEPDASEHLTDLKDAHERMRNLIDELLTLTRNGDVVGETRSVPLADVADDAWATVRTDQTGGDPALEVEDAAPPIRADDERLRTLLENLFGNAVDHAGPDVTVRVGGLADGFYVADDGPGIPPEERDRVFEHGYSTHSNGTGYGLAIVDRIASGHGWETTLTGSADGGARFEFHGVELSRTPGMGDTSGDTSGETPGGEIDE